MVFTLCGFSLLFLSYCLQTLSHQISTRMMAARYIRCMRYMPVFKPVVDCSIHRSHMRTCTSCNSRQKNAQNVSANKSMLTTRTGIIDSSVRFLCQETPLSSLGDTTGKEQNSETKVSELTQSPLAFNVSSKYPNINKLSHPIDVNVEEKQDSVYLDPLEEDDSVEEKRDVSEIPKELLQQKFSEALRKCTTLSDVLDLTMKHSLTCKQSSNCLTTMWDITKKMPEEQKWFQRRLMFEHPAFPQLCYEVMETARKMTSQDLVYSLHALVKLRVSQRTRLIQTLVRVCQERLNEFDERAVSILASSLEVMDGSKNVDTLRSGLQLLVELWIPKITSILSLQTMMRCIGKEAPFSLKKKLEYKALSLMDQFSLPNCQHMFTTLAKIDLLSLPILSVCSNRIIQNVNGIPFWRLIHILRSCSHLQYQNEVLFSTIANYVTSTMYMWQAKQVLLFLSAFENLGFRPPVLLDMFAEQIIQNPESLTLKDVLSILRVYSLFNHLPACQHQRFLDSLTRVLETYLPKIPATELLRAVYSYCVLGYFPKVPFNSLLQENILKELLTSDNQNIELNARLLHHIVLCLELENPSFIKPINIALGKPPPASTTTHPGVQQALHSLLGTTSMFQQNVQLPNNYYIDFQIYMDRDRRKVFPVDEVEASASPFDGHSYRVAVLCCPASSFCLDTMHPKGKLAMKIRHLNVLGYHVVLVHEQAFEKMKEEDQVEFLRRKIFSEDTASDHNLQNHQEVEVRETPPQL